MSEVVLFTINSLEVNINKIIVEINNNLDKHKGHVSKDSVKEWMAEFGRKVVTEIEKSKHEIQTALTPLNIDSHNSSEIITNEV